MRRFVAQSYASARYLREGGPVKTEEDPPDPNPVPAMRESIAAMRHLDEAVTDAGGIALRYGGFYGAANDGLVEPVRKRLFPIVGDGRGVTSFIHLDDAAAATVLALERGRPGVYDVVDDEPAPVREWLPVLAGVLGAKPPRHAPRWLARLVAGEAVVRGRPGPAHGSRLSDVLRRMRIALVAALALLAGLGCLAGVAHADHPGEAARANAAQSPFGPEPPLTPTPQANCGPGSRPETGMQGRVSPEDHQSGRAAQGFTCNAEVVGQYTHPNPIGTVGGFKVERYVDPAGRECAYYDTTLMYPTNALDQEGGVNVLDMSDPARPTLTARLVTPAMQTPHESLVLSQGRGLLVAVAGNLTTQVGQIDIYDLSKDCRHPELRSTTPVGFLGHESGLAPDGRTFYSASPASETIVAVDISNPSLPLPIWFGNYDSHGLSIREGGDRAYVAGVDSGLIILDTGQVQSRVLNPQVNEIARLQWNSMSIPQNAIPLTIEGHSYLVEIDEFGTRSEVGAGRIIDIRDETKPRVISNLRLEVHQKESFEATANDNGANNPVQGYAGHYCNVPTRVDPEIVACSMILSGLRVFDIRDPANPREIAYFNAPVTPRIVPPAGIVPSPSNWAMSSPSFVSERNEIWYSDGLSGFYAVRLTNRAADVLGRRDSRARHRCLARRSPIGPRNIGRIRLGYTRARLRRVPVRPARTTRRSFRYCVKRSSGSVRAVFSRRARVALVATTARAHGNRRLRPGNRVRELRRAYPRRRAAARGIFRANPRSPRLIGVRGGRVRFFAVASRKLVRNPRALARHLRMAGL